MSGSVGFAVAAGAAAYLGLLDKGWGRSTRIGFLVLAVLLTTTAVVVEFA